MKLVCLPSILPSPSVSEESGPKASNHGHIRSNTQRRPYILLNSRCAALETLKSLKRSKEGEENGKRKKIGKANNYSWRRFLFWKTLESLITTKCQPRSLLSLDGKCDSRQHSPREGQIGFYWFQQNTAAAE